MRVFALLFFALAKSEIVPDKIHDDGEVNFLNKLNI